MNKEIIKSKSIGEQYYSFTHESGLQILLYPMKNVSSSYALFGTKYGSIDTTFKTNKEVDFVTVPEGIAHFLEHKLFESEDGDAFSLFAKTGASANAFTSFEKTCYLFSTTDNFEESLDALMTFVQAPYFTKETVEKEQGIIGQEIRMYDDDPDWRVFFNLLVALYHNNPVRIDIAGTVESIAKIDKDLLYRCYNTFYNLNNMCVAVAGNFDAERAIKIIENSLKVKEKIVVETKIPDEPQAVFQKEYVQQLQVSMPLFNIGYKEKPVSEKDEIFYQVRYQLILNAVAGKSTELYKEMYNEGLINSAFGKEVFCGRGFMANIFSGESRNPKEVMHRIHARIGELKKSGIDAETFERLKKSMYGRMVMNYTDPSEVANNLIAAHFSGNNVYTMLDAIADMTHESVSELLQSGFIEDTLAISIVEPVAN